MSRARDRADGDFAGKELIFDADGDTSITADTDDQIDIRIAGADQIKIAAGEVAFNEASGDIDFRVESNGNANMINVDGGNDRVGIGISPSFNAQIDKSSTDTTLTDLTDAQLVLSNTGAATTNQHVKLGFRFQDGSLNGQAMIAAVRESNSARTSSLRFYSAPSSDGNPDERLKIEGAGDVVVSTGDLIFGTAGKGINLGVTSNTDSNTLDDYEEGTWTAGSAVGSINGSNVHYTKVGRLVHFTVKGSFANSSNNEDIEITGLPFAPAVNQAAGQAMWRDLGTVGQGGIAYVTTGSRILFFTEGATASAHDGLRHNEMGSSNEVVLSGTYFT